MFSAITNYRETGFQVTKFTGKLSTEKTNSKRVPTKTKQTPDRSQIKMALIIGPVTFSKSGFSRYSKAHFHPYRRVAPTWLSPVQIGLGLSYVCSKTRKWLQPVVIFLFLKKKGKMKEQEHKISWGWKRGNI